MKCIEIDIENRVNSLIKSMTLNEKIDQIHGIFGFHGLIPWIYRFFYFFTKGVKRLGIPGVIFTDGPRGVNLNRSTCFPVALARGASFNTRLEKEVGRVIGKEARHQGANAIGSTCINLIRHPSWGRSQESFGSDPLHVGEMAKAHVSGLKEYVMPVVKHFVCNSIEKTSFVVSVNIDERAFRELYLPHFKKCIDAKAAAIMSAYNRLNGIHCGENPYILTQILRNEWKFDGFVMSDFFLGCRSTAQSLNAGLDLEMPWGFYYSRRKIKKALKKGEISESVIDDAVRRILRQKIKFGFLNNRFLEIKKVVACKEHTDLALESARQSIVLLKNKNNILPLTGGIVKVTKGIVVDNKENQDGVKRKTVRHIALVGSHADSVITGSIGSTHVNPPWGVTLLQGLQEQAGSAKEAGIDIVVNYCPWGMGKQHKAKKVAALADVVIIATGLTARDEGEFFPGFGGGDRVKLELNPNLVKFIKDIAAINHNTIVVLYGGSAIAVRQWIDSVSALIMAWYPGMQGGRAIVEIIFGRMNPSGRLPISFPRYTEDVPFFDNTSKEVTYDLWHDYRYYDKMTITPEFPFGYGLSYSNVIYKKISIDKKRINDKGQVKITVQVKNDSLVDGTEVVQLYMRYKKSKVTRAVCELKSFKRVFLRAGESKDIIFTIKAVDCAWYNDKKKAWDVEKIEYVVEVGPSSRDLPLRTSFEIN